MKKFFPPLILPFLLLGCDGSQQQPQREEFYTMGTVVDLSFYDVPKETVAKLTQTIKDDFDYLHGAWNPWESGALGQVNRQLPLQAAFSIDPSIRDLVVEATKLSQQSEGMFNPAIGGFVKLWGFSQDVRPEGPPPSDEEIQNIVSQKPNMLDLQLNGLTLRSTNPAVQLDFGGFAKGYAVDIAIDELRKAGVNNAIVNAGGDLRAIGSKGGKPWVIGVRDPRSSGVLASIKITGDESVFTSGDYERFFIYEGKRYHHIIDPRTGYPAHGLTSVTVIHARAAVADASATALLVAGPKDWARIAKAMQLDQVMVVDESGEVFMTPQMEKRVEFVKDAVNYQIVTP